MIYRNLCGDEVSMFAMGTMRLPKTDANDDSSVDAPHVDKMVKYAFEQGVNYFDTAWGYHCGKSEGTMGDALAKCADEHPRESYYIATKFPGYDSSTWGKQEEIFPEQLKRLHTDYIDFYLVHNVCEINIDAYLNEEKYGLRKYLIAQRDAGKIRHLGFSGHGTLETLQRFLNEWGDVMEFMQIQLNYIDHEFQDARAKLELARKYDLPVIVMEPLRGGSLAKGSDEELQKLGKLRPNMSMAGWALRYLQGFEQVKCVLVGSSSLEQMCENIGYFAEDDPLNDEERKTLDEVAQARLQGNIQPCTACNYCASHCPKEINISYMMELYNEHNFTGGGFIAPMAMRAVPEGHRPADCIACGACSAVCPQQIDIPDAMKKFAEMLG